MGTYCYIFFSRNCFQCSRDSDMLCLCSCWFWRTALFLPSFHYLPSQHSRASCSVSMMLCVSELVSEFWVLTWLHYGLRDCYDFSCFAFPEECFTSNYVVNFRVDVMWCWEECIFCEFGLESSVNVYQVCLFQVWVQFLDILVNFLSGLSV